MDVREKVKRELMYHTYPQESICEKLRSIYDDVHNIKDGKTKKRLTEKLIDAYIMAKKMDERLEYYWTTYQDKTGESGGNLMMILDYEERKTLRTARRDREES